MVENEEIDALVAERDNIDREISKYLDVLKSNNVDMETELIDKDDFPRADINVSTIRFTRNKIICLQNDWKASNSRIESALHDLHDSSIPDRNKHSHVNANDEVVSHRTTNEPMAIVSKVIPGSPADIAGLHAGDAIIQFGPLCAANLQRLAQIAEIVTNSVQKQVRISVIRSDHPVRLILIPTKWSGQGLLGCGIIPTCER